MPITIEVVDDTSSSTPSDQGYLRVRRLALRNRLSDGRVGEVYRYDVVDRAAPDAVVMLLRLPNPGNAEDPLVVVRTALRPPVALRRGRRLPVPDARDGTQLWELPAGIIELGEEGMAGILGCAARETLEETGYAVPVLAFRVLGPPVYLSPGMAAEKIHFVTACVEPGSAGRPTLDGSQVEAHAEVEAWPLSSCLAKVASGELEDAKTEIALRRFAAGPRSTG
jgi:ADP-ribose pyrophosphatase